MCVFCVDRNDLPVNKFLSWLYFRLAHNDSVSYPYLGVLEA